MSPRHQGRSVLVTGAASGIGRGIAERFLADGARLTGLDLNPSDLRHDRFLPLTGDAASEADVERAVAEAAAWGPGLDVMVCNAGVIDVRPVVDTPLADWRRVMSVNADSVFLGARAAARVMIAQGRGGVILTAASGAGKRGVPNLAAYCASKAAVIVFTQALAVELAPHRIRANAYAPGHIETPFWGGIAEGFSRVTGRTPEDVVEGFRASVPWGRFGTPSDVAAAVSWLASDEAEYVSGQTVAMNGAEFPS